MANPVHGIHDSLPYLTKLSKGHDQITDAIHNILQLTFDGGICELFNGSIVLKLHKKVLETGLIKQIMQVSLTLIATKDYFSDNGIAFYLYCILR